MAETRVASARAPRCSRRMPRPDRIRVEAQLLPQSVAEGDSGGQPLRRSSGRFGKTSLIGRALADSRVDAAYSGWATARGLPASATPELWALAPVGKCRFAAGNKWGPDAPPPLGVHQLAHQKGVWRNSFRPGGATASLPRSSRRKAWRRNVLSKGLRLARARGRLVERRACAPRMRGVDCNRRIFGDRLQARLPLRGR